MCVCQRGNVAPYESECVPGMDVGQDLHEENRGAIRCKGVCGCVLIKTATGETDGAAGTLVWATMHTHPASGEERFVLMSFRLMEEMLSLSLSLSLHVHSLVGVTALGTRVFSKGCWCVEQTVSTVP